MKLYYDYLYADFMGTEFEVVVNGIIKGERFFPSISTFLKYKSPAAVRNLSDEEIYK